MNYKNLFAFLLLLPVCLACQQKIDPRFDQFEKTALMLKYQDLLNQEAVLLIPNGGCDGCITSAEGFAMRNIGTTENFCVVFTGTESQKTLRLKIGDHLYHHQKVVIDKENLFYKSYLMSFYPTIIYLKNRKVVKIVEQNPQTINALDSLQSVLLQAQKEETN